MDSNAETIICRNVKRLRIAHGLSQAELADALGKSQSTISMIEGEFRQPSREFTLELADFFNVSLDVFMRDEIMPDKQVA